MYLITQIQEKNEREEAERKKRIQLYVFILRSVAYPFNAKQPSDMNKRHLKVTKDGHEKMKARIEVKLISNYSTFMTTYLLISVAKIFGPKQWNQNYFRAFFGARLKFQKMRPSKIVLKYTLPFF